jgi:hypothetical protein
LLRFKTTHKNVYDPTVFLHLGTRLVARPPCSAQQRLGSFLVSVLIAAMPITLLTEFARASTVFYILAAISAIICVSRAGGYQAVLSDWKDYRGLAAALFVSLVVITIAATRGTIRIDNEIERALRLCAYALRRHAMRHATPCGGITNDAVFVRIRELRAALALIRVFQCFGVPMLWRCAVGTPEHFRKRSLQY